VKKADPKLSRAQQELVAHFEQLALVPPSNEGKLLVRYSQCKEWQTVAEFLHQALDRSMHVTDTVLRAPGELLPPMA
jgi:hypothetical protein